MHDLLLHATHPTTPLSGAMRYAAQLAAALDGRLTGLHIGQLLPTLATPEAVPMSASLYAAAREQLQRAREAEPALRDAVAALGATRFRWLVCEGWVPDVLTAAGTWHDLLVLGGGNGTAWGEVTGLGQILLSVDLPCLIVPAAYSTEPRFERVAVAWNGAPEAMRALHVALPLLRRARRIRILRGTRAPLRQIVGNLVPFTLEEYLDSHGLQAEHQFLEPGDDTSVGAAVLAAAREANAELLVMGAYGRSRFSEWILGGVTRHALEHSPIPLFLRH